MSGPWARWLRLPLTWILAAAALLRFRDLDYSHFQGDEIKALLPEGVSVGEFLLAQKKGPGQYLVTLAVRSIAGEFDEGLTRLPFATASLLAVYVLHRLMAENFGKRPALLATALLGTSGLFVAFGRIVQYQAFVILLVSLTAYFMLRWLRSGSLPALHAGAVFYALALLTHYDALTFAPCLLVIVVARLRRGMGATRAERWHLVSAGTMFTVLVSAFYLPYVLRPEFGRTWSYLASRMFAGRGLESFGSTFTLLDLYLPPTYLELATVLLALGLGHVLAQHRTSAGYVLLVWFAFTFATYMLAGGDARTHVYNYFLPGLALVALGIESVIGFARSRSLARSLEVVAWLTITTWGATTYYMIVDHSIEHPWSGKKILGYELPNLESGYLDGIFGFPYRRGLDEVGELFASGQLQGSFDSNEKQVVTDYYFRAPRSSPSDYYVHVHRPLSLQRELPRYVRDGYALQLQIPEYGQATIDVYARNPRGES